MSELMASFVNNITNFNKETHYIGNYIHERGEDTGNILPQISATYDDCSSDNGPFIRYIEMLENQYDDGTLNF